MKKTCRRKRVRKGNNPADEPAPNRGSMVREEHEDMVKAAIEASMHRFLEMNRDSILRSSKEKTATTSYCSGMYDMITLLRSALGRWAVQQVLAELEEWNRIGPVGEGTQVRIDVTGAEIGGISQEDAKELGVQIAKWVEERKGNGKRQCKDPMFV